MKKIYDLKPRSSSAKMRGLGLKKVKKPNYFWDDDNLKITPRLKRATNDQKLNRAIKKSLAFFFILSVLFCLAFARWLVVKNELNVLSANAKKHLTETFAALESGDINEALEKAEKSSAEIKQIRLNLQAWGQDSTSINYLSSKKSKLGNYELLLRAADLSLSSIINLRREVGSQFETAVKSEKSENSSPGEIKINFDRQKLNQIFYQAKRDMDQSLTLLDDLDPNVVAIDNFNIDSAKLSIKKLRQSVDVSGQILTEDIPWLSGAGGERKILILFVNNNELRGGGGFIGSYAVANFSDKALKNIDFQTNIYKLDNKFTAKNTVTPPKELGFLDGGKWSLRDANWALDFPESALKVEEFYRLESGQKVDGIMSIDTSIIIELLKVAGPIEMPEYNLTITDQNFAKEVQNEVEVEYFQRPGGKTENEPKKILAEMMPKFISKILANFSDSQKLLPTIAALSKAVQGKHLAFQFSNQEFQNRLDQINYSGKIPNTDDDFLLVSNTNIGGLKSSQNVAESFQYKVNIAEDGSQKSQINIGRQHNGNGEPPDGDNKNLARILLPKGTVIDKFEPLSGNFLPLADQKYAGEPIYYSGEEAGYSKLSFWINTTPQQASKAAAEMSSPIKYDLSQKEFYYKLRIQKQMGSGVDDYELIINYPKDFYPVNVEYFNQKNHQISIKDKLDQDKIYTIKFRKK